MPHPSASPHPGRHGGGAADLSGVLLPLVRPGAARGRALSGTSPGRTCRWCWIPRCCWRERIGRPQQGRRRGPGLYPLLLHQPPRRPGTLYPPPGGGDGAAGGAAVRRTPEGPPQGPLHSQRRSGGVSGSVPGCRLCVHQLLPRNGVLRPVPKALLYGGGTGRDGCAGEFPDLQPVEPPGTGGADHRQGRYRGPDGAHRLGGGGGAGSAGSGSCPWTICAAPWRTGPIHRRRRLSRQRNGPCPIWRTTPTAPAAWPAPAAVPRTPSPWSGTGRALPIR